MSEPSTVTLIEFWRMLKKPTEASPKNDRRILSQPTRTWSTAAGCLTATPPLTRVSSSTPAIPVSSNRPTPNAKIPTPRTSFACASDAAACDFDLDAAKLHILCDLAKLNCSDFWRNTSTPIIFIKLCETFIFTSLDHGRSWMTTDMSSKCSRTRRLSSPLQTIHSRFLSRICRVFYRTLCQFGRHAIKAIYDYFIIQANVLAGVVLERQISRCLCICTLCWTGFSHLLPHHYDSQPGTTFSPCTHKYWKM